MSSLPLFSGVNMLMREVHADGRAEHNESVDVYFQSCAWMDSDIKMQSVEKTLVPGVGKSGEEKVIFAVNVTFQQEKQFHDACRRELNAIFYLLSENHTDMKCSREKWEKRWISGLSQRTIWNYGMIN